MSESTRGRSLSSRKSSKRLAASLMEIGSKSHVIEEITLEELAQHDSKRDAWMAIRGRVYDITFFINEHPGGEKPLLKYAGKDGTKAFNDIHSYVDYKTLLKGHLKGVLAHTPEGDPNASSKMNDTQRKCCACFRKKNKNLPINRAFHDSPFNVLYEVKFSKKISQEEDWSSGIEEIPSSEGFILRVHKFIDSTNVWLSSYYLAYPITGLELSFRDDFNTCEITLRKPEGRVQHWKTLGTANPEDNSIIDSNESTELHSAFIVYKQALTPDVNLYGVRVSLGSFSVHIGHHIYISVEEVRRPYTPVCFSMLPSTVVPQVTAEMPGSGPILWFIIKNYTGQVVGLTHKLNKLPMSKDTPNLKVTFPIGVFDQKFLFPHHTDLLLLFAGGTGITPMIKIIQNLYLQEDKGCRKIVLFYWNKDESDIIWREQFEELRTNQSTWFKFLPILTKPKSSTWRGFVGRPSVQLIKTMLSSLPHSFDAQFGTHACVCGSTGFNEAIEGATRDLFPKERIFVFAG